MSEELEKKVDEIVNDFLLKEFPDLYPHYVDTDDNGGQRLRVKLYSLIKQERIRYGEWLLSSESDVRKAEPADDYERGYDYGYDEARAELRQRNKGL